MKRSYSQLILASMVIITMIAGCKKNELKHTQVTPVNNLYAPENNAYFNLGVKNTATFEWEAAKAEDNGVVLYDVLFDKEDGDFSNPVYIIPSDGNGLQRTLNIPFSDLNRIAEMAGIGPEGIAKLKWTVVSSKGINVQNPIVSRLIEIERPAGFPTPAELYISGSATEGGDDLSKAIMLKQVTSSAFEIYTSLKAGEYFFAEKNSGTPVTYFIDGNKLKSNGKTQVSGAEKVYRIKVDFKDATTDIIEIESVGLWFAPDDKFLFEIPYLANGVWEKKDANIVFKQESWGRDERYKFRFKTKDSEGSSTDIWYGSVNNDNQRPTSTTPASFWYMTLVTSDRWNNSFKFDEAVDNATSTVRVIFNGSVPEYTHSVTPQ